MNTILLLLLLSPSLREPPLCVAPEDAPGEEALCCSGRPGKETKCLTLDAVSPEVAIDFYRLCSREGGTTSVEIAVPCDPQDPGEGPQ